MQMVYNFFATREEVYDLWDWLASQPGMRLIEADSRPDMPLREFERFPRLEWEAITPASGFSIVIWTKDLDENPELRFVQFEPQTAQALKAKGRSTLISPAFMRMSEISAPTEEVISPVELLFWTEKLATKSQRFSPEQMQRIDWKGLSKCVAGVKREIKARSVGSWRSLPVSKEVAKTLSEGHKRLWFWGATGTI